MTKRFSFCLIFALATFLSGLTATGFRTFRSDLPNLEVSDIEITTASQFRTDYPTAVLRDRDLTGGLGMTDAEWKELFGNPAPFGRDAWVYRNGRYITRSWADISGDVNHHVKSIEIVWGNQNSARYEEARAEVKRFFPNDTKFVRKLTRGGMRGSELFSSVFLARRITPLMAGTRDCITPWGYRPGQFIVRYHFVKDRVSRAVLEIGEPHETELSACGRNS
jgi:hypothetical protein